MSRSTQFVGLSEQACKFLEKNAKKIGFKPCPHCGKNTEERYDIVKDNRYTHGMFMEKIPLQTYRLKDGKLAKEVVQAEPWSSGPVIFTVLEIDGSWVGSWPQEAINDA